MIQKSHDDRMLWAQFDALEMGSGWDDTDILKPQIMIESVYGDSHPGSTHLNQMVEQAVYGHTMGAAYASYDERVSGSLSVGKRADMAVVDRDIFTIPPAQIKEARVVMTVLDGEIVYEREER